MKRKIIGIISIILILISCLNAITLATSIDVNLYSKGRCGQILKKDGVILRIPLVVHIDENGNEYPAYCLDRTKDGVDSDSYAVKIEEKIKDVRVWRAIINGYPYKSIAQLGCATEKEAFAATKMAVYAMLYDYDLNSFEGIGEEGIRTKNAIEKIVRDANNSVAVPDSSNIEIIDVNNEWKYNNGIIYKTFEITAKNSFDDYKIKKISGEYKITDEKFNEKETFKPQERFNVCINIKNTDKKGNVSFNIETRINNNPIFYGESYDKSRQDYAITGIKYENVIQEKNLEYEENKTKLVIIKKDIDENKLLKNAIFNIYNEKKELIYTNLKTNEKGEINLEGFIPGKYYLKEIIAPENYETTKEMIEFEVKYNTEKKIVIDNKQKQVPNVEKEEIMIKPIENSKKLPKTGM